MAYDQYAYNHGPTQLPVTGTTGNPDWPYYVLSAGIEHNVIQTDIGRWLGNDAVVRRTTFQGADVYIYKGYRQLTSAMINSLREDTIKWETERSYSGSRDFHSSRTFYDRQQRDARDPPRGTRAPAPVPETNLRYTPPDPSAYDTGHVLAAPGYGENPLPGTTHLGRVGPHHHDTHQERPERRERERDRERDRDRRPRTNRTATERDSRYAYDEATGQPYYDLITRQYLNPAYNPAHQAHEVPRTVNPEAPAPGVAPVRYPYTSASASETHYYPTHDARGYAGPPPDNE